MIRQYFLVLGLFSMLILGGAVFAQDATPTAPVEGEMPAEPLAPVEGEVIEGPTLESVTADPGAVYGQEVTLEGVLAEFVNVRTFVLSEGAALDDDKVLVINNTPIEFDPSLVAGERVQITGIVMPSYNEGGFDQVISNFMNIIRPGQSPGDTGAVDAAATPADAAADDASSVDTAETPAAAIPGAADTAADATPAEGAMDEATDAEPTPDQAAAVNATPAEGAEPVEATPMVPADTTAQTLGMSFDNVDWTPLTNAIAERFSDFTIVEITSIDAVTFIPTE